ISVPIWDAASDTSLKYRRDKRSRPTTCGGCEHPVGGDLSMETSLLSHIAMGFITQYENVANSGVCYLLNRYPAARSALAKVLSFETVPLRYMTERTSKRGGRPDVTGLGSDGSTAIIIEGK